MRVDDGRQLLKKLWPWIQLSLWITSSFSFPQAFIHYQQSGIVDEPFPLILPSKKNNISFTTPLLFLFPTISYQKNKEKIQESHSISQFISCRDDQDLKGEQRTPYCLFSTSFLTSNSRQSMMDHL